MFKQTNEGFQDKQLTSVATVIIRYLRALKLQETVGVGWGVGAGGVWGDYNQGESPEMFPQESPNQRTPHIESRMNLVSRHV